MGFDRSPYVKRQTSRVIRPRNAATVRGVDGGPGNSRRIFSGVTKEALEVVTLTISGAEEVPLTVTGVIAGVHADSEGAPVHVMATAPMNPPIGFTCKLYTAVFPVVTEADNEPPLATPSEKSGTAVLILVTNPSPAPLVLD
jgi:hypothetical protein